MKNEENPFLMSGTLVGYEIGEREGMHLVLTLEFAQSPEDFEAGRFAVTSFAIHPEFALELAQKLEKHARSLTPGSAPGGTRVH